MTRISTRTRLIAISYCDAYQKEQRFLLFFSIKKGNERAGQKSAHIGAYRKRSYNNHDNSVIDQCSYRCAQRDGMGDFFNHSGQTEMVS